MGEIIYSPSGRFAWSVQMQMQAGCCCTYLRFEQSGEGTLGLGCLLERVVHDAHSLVEDLA